MSLGTPFGINRQNTDKQPGESVYHRKVENQRAFLACSGGGDAENESKALRSDRRLERRHIHIKAAVHATILLAPVLGSKRNRWRANSGDSRRGGDTLRGRRSCPL